jgi:hypothetical protein
MNNWLDRYNDRERLQIAACRSYAAHFSSAGLPGHNLMLLIASLVTQLERANRLFNGLPPDDTDPDPDFPTDSVLLPAVPVPEQVEPMPATERQLKAIYAIARSARGWDADRLDHECFRMFERLPHQLTLPEASQLIDHLKSGLSLAGYPVS